MSWFLTTLIFVFACLVAALVLTEWVVRRRRGGPGGDQDSLT